MKSQKIFMWLTDAFNKLSSAIKKNVEKSKIESQRRKEIIRLKKIYLSKLSHKELIQIYKSYKPLIDPSLFDLGLPQIEERRIDPNKLSRRDLVNILSRNLTWVQVYDEVLISSGKDKLAEEFKREIEWINEKYRRLIAEITGEKPEEEDSILLHIVETIVTYMKRELYKISATPMLEYDFHSQIESFFRGLKPLLENKFSKLGKIDIEREYRVLQSFGRRIDFMIFLGNYRIGIEVKYSIDDALKELLGQIDLYIPHCDAMIILGYKPVSSSSVKEIKNKEQEKRKMIKILAPNKVV